MKDNKLVNNPVKHRVVAGAVGLFMLVLISSTGGCYSTIIYDGTESDKWLTEQVEKGYITDSQFVDYLNLYVRKHTVYKDRIYHKMIVVVLL